MWFCKCECGNNAIVSSAKLKNGHTKSCGCLSKEVAKEKATIHGKTKTTLYRRWANIKTRCFNINHKSYKNYGAKGITMCDEWAKDFMSFYDWAIKNGYSKELTIDRINVNGNYEPSNCRWVNTKAQANNRNSNVFIMYKGKTQTIHQWADEYNIKYNTFWARLNKYDWNIEKALTIKPKDTI